MPSRELNASRLLLIYLSSSLRLRIAAAWLLFTYSSSYSRSILALLSFSLFSSDLLSYGDGDDDYGCLLALLLPLSLIALALSSRLLLGCFTIVVRILSLGVTVSRSDAIATIDFE